MLSSQNLRVYLALGKKFEAISGGLELFCPPEVRIPETSTPL